MKRITLTLFDKDSSRTTSETFLLTEDLAKEVNEFRKDCKYRYYEEAYSDDSGFNKKERKWLEKAEIDEVF